MRKKDNEVIENPIVDVDEKPEEKEKQTAATNEKKSERYFCNKLNESVPLIDFNMQFIHFSDEKSKDTTNAKTGKDGKFCLLSVFV